MICLRKWTFLEYIYFPAARTFIREPLHIGRACCFSCCYSQNEKLFLWTTSQLCIVHFYLQLAFICCAMDNSKTSQANHHVKHFKDSGLGRIGTIYSARQMSCPYSSAVSITRLTAPQTLKFIFVWQIMHSSSFHVVYAWKCKQELVKTALFYVYSVPYHKVRYTDILVSYTRYIRNKRCFSLILVSHFHAYATWKLLE